MTSKDDLPPVLEVEGVSKSFRMHLRSGLAFDVLSDVTFTVRPGECVVLGGPSGVGKSSILRTVYGNYGADNGAIRLRDKDGSVRDMAAADPRGVLALRRSTVAYVSQFLRAVPRVAAIDVAAEPLVARGLDRDAARARAGALLDRMNLPRTMQALPPATFSGGEKQRVNIARGFSTDHPLLLLDEPTASLDAENREVVVGMIAEKLAAGVAILGIFHDKVVRDRVATRIVDVSAFSARKAA